MNGYASPVLRGIPTVVLIDSDTAKEVLRRCRLYPRQQAIDQEKLKSFIDLIQTGRWKVDKSAPIMISARGVILNGRHRLTALAQSGGEALMPVLDELKILLTIKTNDNEYNFNSL